MNDVQILSGLFNKWGVGHTVNNVVSKYTPNVHTTITCQQGMEKVNGYRGFEVVYNFDKEGIFIDMVVAEE